jgi:hypothetical protein
MRFILPVSLALAALTATALTEAQSRGANPQSGQAPVTFTKDVAPILQNHCQVCHRPNTFAPMSLLSYEDARPWAKAIKQKVVAREMPPWFIDKNVGIQHFSNDVSLTDEEIATIVNWADGGGEKGNPADMPPSRTFPDENRWQFTQPGGEPDLVASLPKDYVMRASGADQYPSILVDPALKEDRYLNAVQIIPTKGYTAIHHIRTSLVAPTDDSVHAGQLDPNGPVSPEEMGVFLNEYAIGKGADVFPDGSGRLIKAGTKVNVSFHLHATGKETPVNIALGLKFYPKGYKPKHTIISATVSSQDVDIRPNTADARSDNYRLLTKPTRLLSYQPHMHTRGKAACMEAILPTAEGGFHIEPLNCARFLFNWHLNYVYAEDSAPLLPAGTMLHMIEWHDNSAGNKVNPDPDAQVTYGQRTIDEMNGPWISFYEMSEQEFKQEVEARRTQQPSVASLR